MTKKYILALLLLSILTIVYAQENQTENLIVTDNALNLSNEAAVDNVSTEIFLNETIGITQNVTNETVIAPAIVCNETQCDNTCVVCSDQKCHAPDFKCVESAVIEKFLPTSVGIGTNQINIVVRNTGNVDLSNIYVELTGDGITTT